jgi:hypothetical protein
MRVRIAQCLCGPARHCIFALAVTDDLMSDAGIIKGLTAIIEARAFGPCALCGRGPAAWQYEVRWSKEYPSWEAAQRELQRIEQANLATRAQIDRLRRSTN